MRRALALIVLLVSSLMLLMSAAAAGPGGGSRTGGGLASIGGAHASVVRHAGPVGGHVRPANHHESSNTNNPVESWCAQQRRSAPECGQTPIAPTRRR